MTTTIEASGLVAALEAAWTAIQKRHADVPAVVVTLGAGSVGVPRGALKLGHFAAERWVNGDEAVAELFVGGEGLARGAEAVLTTLLHEAAHGVATTRGVQDTSRQGRYHNGKFKATAEEMGLTITRAPGIGWSDSALAEGTAAEYAAEVSALAEAITTYRHIEGFLPTTGAGTEDDGEGDGQAEDDEAPKKPKNGVSWVCGCATPRRIRLSATAAEVGPITCGICGQEFTEPDE